MRKTLVVEWFQDIENGNMIEGKDSQLFLGTEEQCAVFVKYIGRLRRQMGDKSIRFLTNPYTGSEYVRYQTTIDNSECFGIISMEGIDHETEIEESLQNIF